MNFPPRCYACNATLVDEKGEYDNTLTITLDGGYGQFVESDSFFLYSDFWATLSVEVRTALRKGVVDEYAAKHPEYDHSEDDGDVDTPIMGVLTPELILQFRDYVDEHREHKAVICHECAHELCAKVPWMERLINSHNSHSHHMDYVAAHPDHYGWDYTRRAEEDA